MIEWLIEVLKCATNYVRKSIFKTLYASGRPRLCSRDLSTLEISKTLSKGRLDSHQYSVCQILAYVELCVDAQFIQSTLPHMQQN